MILKELVNKILLEQPETRNSDKLLQWKVLTRLGLVDFKGFDQWITKENFIKAPEFESIRRCRQALQRSDLLTGTKLIQPTKEIKQKRVKLSKERGYSFIQGKQWIFNPLTQSYEEQ